MRRLLAIFCVVSSMPCAALEVIRDAGGEPIAPYLMRLIPPAEAVRPLGIQIAPPDRTYSLIKHLPIRSPTLTPALVEARETPIRLLQPLFLVGGDPHSLQWLEANRERLKELHAIGMLVQAETERELNAATEIAQGLPLIPASGEAFAAEIGLRHYPVLITRKGIAP